MTLSLKDANEHTLRWQLKKSGVDKCARRLAERANDLNASRVKLPSREALGQLSPWVQYYSLEAMTVDTSYFIVRAPALLRRCEGTCVLVCAGWG